MHSRHVFLLNNVPSNRSNAVIVREHKTLEAFLRDFEIAKVTAPSYEAMEQVKLDEALAENEVLRGLLERVKGLLAPAMDYVATALEGNGSEGKK